MNLPETTAQIVRVFDAPLKRVYAAWTERDLLKKWWGPEGVETHELILETRVGGKFRCLVFTWTTDDSDAENAESIVTVEFLDQGAAATELRLLHENLPSEESCDEHTDGWNSALDKLEDLLAT